MPSDSRRIQGPENTTPYSLYIKENKTYEDLVKTILKNGQRKDGRSLKELRRICKYICICNFVFNMN